MQSDWLLKTIAECAAQESYSTQIGPFGKALMAYEYTLSGVPVLRGVNVNHGRFHDEDFVFISEEKADELAKFESYPGDVLLVHKGTLGKIGLMPNSRKYGRYILGNSMMRVRCDPKKLLPGYLYYWLSSREGQDYLFSRISQVGVPQLQTPLSSLREATLPVPTIPEQCAITEFLGKLDDRIELNEQMNKTLGAIGDAVFKQWFVNFEFLNENGEPYKSSGRDMVDSEFGLIPKGWKVGKVANMCSTQYGYTASSSLTEIGPHLLRVTDINKQPWIDWKDVPYCKISDDDFRRYKLEIGDVLVSRMADPGKTAIVEEDTPSVFASYLIRLKTKTLEWSYYLFYFLQSQRYLDYAEGAISGSVQASMNAKVITAAEMLIPSEEAVTKFFKIVLPLRQQITNNLQQSFKPSATK